MMDFVTILSDVELMDLAEAIQTGRVRAPYTELGIAALLSREKAPLAAMALEQLSAAGASPDVVASMLSAVAEDRRARRAPTETIDLVTTGPEAAGVTNRDTSVVVRELFIHAERTVLVVGYAVHQGLRVFSALADRMQERPNLQVRLFLDIQRPYTDTSMASELVRRFRERLITSQWPPDRPFPTVYYYPPSLELEPQKRSSLHAKCVVVDEEVSFISSANFTEAAQLKNIEVGVLIRSAPIARQLTGHFEALIKDHLVAQLDMNRSY